MNFVIERAHIDDSEEILKLQHLAYQSEAAIYNDFALPPLTQSLAELKEEFANSVVLVCRAERPTHDNRSNSAILGSVRARKLDGRCLIARLIVRPDMQRKGIGSRLMAAIEEEFPTVEAYELFTGHRSEGNLRLYRRLGYREFKTERAGLGLGLELVFLKKTRIP